MAGPSIQAEVDVMSGVSSQFQGHYDSLQSAISMLQGESAAHAASWNGETRKAYDVAMEGVNSAWNNLNNVLEKISGAISSSASNYSNTDSTGASQINTVDATGITSGLRGV